MCKVQAKAQSLIDTHTSTDQLCKQHWRRSYKRITISLLYGILNYSSSNQGWNGEIKKGKQAKY